MTLLVGWVLAKGEEVPFMHGTIACVGVAEFSQLPNSVDLHQPSERTRCVTVKISSSELSLSQILKTGRHFRSKLL